MREILVLTAVLALWGVWAVCRRSQMRKATAGKTAAAAETSAQTAAAAETSAAPLTAAAESPAAPPADAAPESPEKPPVVPVPRRPMDGKMEQRGTGRRMDYDLYTCGTTRIVWVSPDGSERTPANDIQEIASGTVFEAAGRRYASLKEIEYRKLGNNRWMDVHGREWLNLYEPYPCFDSSDRLHERRFYDWFFLQDGNCITRVFGDGGGRLYVTEDTGEIESRWLEEIQKSGYLL